MIAVVQVVPEAVNRILRRKNTGGLEQASRRSAARMDFLSCLRGSERRPCAPCADSGQAEHRFRRALSTPLVLTEGGWQAAVGRSSSYPRRGSFRPEEDIEAAGDRRLLMPKRRIDLCRQLGCSSSR